MRLVVERDKLREQERKRWVGVGFLLWAEFWVTGFKVEQSCNECPLLTTWCLSLQTFEHIQGTLPHTICSFESLQCLTSFLLGDIYILQSSCTICFVANEISRFHCLCRATQHNPNLAVCSSPSHHKRWRISLWASSRLLLACTLAQTVVTVMWVTMCQQANTDLELHSSLSCGKPYQLGSMKAGTKTTVSH